MDLFDLIQQRKELSLSSISTLRNAMEQVAFAKNEVIVGAGSRDDYVYFVQQGLVRGYILRDGVESMVLFAAEGEMVNSLLGYAKSRISKITLECVEPSILYRITKTEFEILLTSSLELSIWGRKMAEQKLAAIEDYFLCYFWEDKTAQYLTFLKEYPRLVQRIALKDLASYLNVTPQSLSRIRANIRE